MTISTEDLTRMAEGRHVFGHQDGLALAAELIAARAKIEAAEKLAEAVKHEREMVCQDMGMQMDLSAWTDEMLAKWESLK